MFIETDIRKDNTTLANATATQNRGYWGYQELSAEEMKNVAGAGCGGCGGCGGGCTADTAPAETGGGVACNSMEGSSGFGIGFASVPSAPVADVGICAASQFAGPPASTDSATNQSSLANHMPALTNDLAALGISVVTSPVPGAAGLALGIFGDIVTSNPTPPGSSLPNISDVMVAP